MNPQGYAEQLQKDKETAKALGNLAKKGGKWAYRNSVVNMALNPNDYVAAQAENKVMMDKLIEKAKEMDAEDWGELTGQIGFEIILEVATVGAAAALTTLKVADKTVDAARALEKLDDLADTAKGLEKIKDVGDGLKGLDEFGDVFHYVDEAFDFKKYKMADGQKLGDFGEEVVEDMLRKDGYDEFYRVQNNSGNGVDIVAKNSKTGDIIRAEVKSTKQERYWKNGEKKEIPLRGDQKTMGGEDYATDRLDRAANGDDGYTDGTSTSEAKRAQDAINEAKENGNVIENKKYDVYVDKDGNLLDNPVERPWEPNP